MKKIFLSDIICLFKGQSVNNEFNDLKFKKVFFNLIIFILFIFFVNILNVMFLLILGYKTPPVLKSIDETLPYEIILVAPFVEEMFFRFPLKKSKKNLYIFLVFLTLFLLMKFNFVYKVYIYIMFLFLFLYQLFFSKSLISKENNYNNKTSLFLIILLSTLFGLFHVVNFEKPGEFINYYLLIFSISKIITGISLSVIRLRFGVLISILFHAFFNLIIYLIN